MKKFVFALLVWSCSGGLMVAFAQDYDEINLKNYKKFEGNCNSMFVSDNSDAFIEKKNLETHRFLVTEKGATNILTFSLFRNAGTYQIRVMDKEKDIRGISRCKIKLSDDTQIDLPPVDAYGEKLDKGNYTRRNFKITKEQLETLKEKGIKYLRLERDKEFINYPVDAEQNNVFKPAIVCITQ
jgi:precorrin-6x reductase